MTDKSRTLSSPRELLEQALESTKGIRVWFETSAQAKSMINRMATVKTSSRKQSTKTYPFGHALYNTSPYDGIATYIQPVEVYQGEPSPGYPTYGVWLYICPESFATEGLFIEELK